MPEKNKSQNGNRNPFNGTEENGVKRKRLVNHLLNGGGGTKGQIHRELDICYRTISKTIKVLVEKKIVIRRNNHVVNSYFLSKNYYGEGSEEILKLISEQVN